MTNFFYFSWPIATNLPNLMLYHFVNENGSNKNIQVIVKWLSARFSKSPHQPKLQSSDQEKDELTELTNDDVS